MKKTLKIIIVILFLFLVGCNTQGGDENNNNNNNSESKYIEEELGIDNVLVTLQLTENYNSEDYESINIELLKKHQLEKYIDETEFTNLLLIMKFKFKYESFNDEIKQSFEGLKTNTDDFKEIKIEYFKPYDYQKYVDINKYITGSNKIENYKYVVDIQSNYNLIYSYLLKKQIYTSFDEFNQEVRDSIKTIVEEIRNTTIMGTDYFLKISKVGQYDLLLKKYDEDYFKENDLIISEPVYNTSISVNISVKDLYYENSKIYIQTLTKYPKQLEDTMLFSTILIDMPKSNGYSYDEIKVLN